MTWKDKYGKKIKKIIKQATGLITADDGTHTKRQNQGYGPYLVLFSGKKQVF